MAPPNKRRPGFSRKAQYKIFTGYLVAFLGAFGGLFLLAISYLDPTAFSAIRKGAADATKPVTEFFTAARSTGQKGTSKVSAYFDAASKNAEMQRELEKSRTQLIEARALKQENERLKSLLGLVEEEAKPVAIARLISSSSSSTRRFATLGAGSNQGVESGQPVREQKGLIGRILDVGANTSRVLLLTDASNVVPVKRASDGIVAFAEGRGDDIIHIRLINIGTIEIKPGDIFVTSGNGGLYSPNIPVAIVDRPASDGALGRPLSNPAGADFVVVQPIYQPELVPAAKGGSADDSSDAQTATEDTAEENGAAAETDETAQTSQAGTDSEAAQ